MLKDPFLYIVAVTPLLSPENPKPLVRTISLVTIHVLGIFAANSLLDCRVTLTTSKGFTKIASVTPAPRPANEKVYNTDKTCNLGYNHYRYC